MKISTKGRYGLRAAIDVAIFSGQQAVPISEIAERQQLSESYLEQLMAKLRKADIVKSVRGAQGGYVLAKSPSEISVGDILRSLEGDLRPVDCLAIKEDNKCHNGEMCVTKFVWEKINESINDTVDGITLQDILDQNLKKNADEPICDCGL